MQCPVPTTPTCKRATWFSASTRSMPIDVSFQLGLSSCLQERFTKRRYSRVPSKAVHWCCEGKSSHLPRGDGKCFGLRTPYPTPTFQADGLLTQSVNSKPRAGSVRIRQRSQEATSEKERRVHLGKMKSQPFSFFFCEAWYIVTFRCDTEGPHSFLVWAVSLPGP